MKKTLLFAAALLVLASCTREVDVEIPDGGVTLTARTEGSAASRTIVEGETHVYWEPGDEIKVFVGANSAQFTTDITASAATAPFSGTLEIAGGDDIWAVYPYSADAAFAEGAFTMALPAAQTARAGSFEKDLNLAIAHTTEWTLPFKNVTGGVKFTVSQTGITHVTFKGNNAEPLAGSVKVSLDANGIPAVSENLDPATEITLSAPAGSTFEAGQPYFIVALPAELPNGYSLTLTYQDGHKEVLRSDNAIEIKRSRFGALANVDTKAETPVPTFRISKMWVVGGTSPEYGGVGAINILTADKYKYWNNEDGRGIDALVDNYYQLKPDGTFVNYAGADARNWWFVYSGTVNPVDHKDIDLRKFYDVLPLKDGRYSVDGAQVTFTKADGSTTTATLVGPGSYEIPGSTKTVTIQSQALLFTITGGKDDWDNIYKDYDKIAAHPRQLYIEMEQMPDDFIVPAASRTTDADFKYEAPEEPGGSFDWTTIPGNWNVYGGNSAPFGLWVLGGSGDDPSFESPIDKSWNWDDTIWKESDNVLAIAVTNFTETTATGTTNWWAGNDGKFWNYTWKKTGEDLSRFYNKIPKGKVGFTLDFATLTITWDNGTTAKVLLPGNHTFVYGKSLKVPIPDDCFAIWFHLMDPIAPTADRWNDVDRFVNAPLEYLIYFEKK